MSVEGCTTDGASMGRPVSKRGTTPRELAIVAFSEGNAI
jgi:hypothetical protein